MSHLELLPIPFYLSLVALISVSAYAWRHLERPWALPLGLVLFTTAVWYHGDALYNDYGEYHILMGEEALAKAWFQVLLFILALAVLVRPMHRWVNSRFGDEPSQLLRYVRTRRLEHPVIQRQVDRLCALMFAAWLALMGIALYLVEFDVVGLFAPYLGDKVNPWARGRMGQNIDALLSLAAYFQIFLAAGFGVIAAVARNRVTRGIALVVCFLTFPYYIFDRTRNAMLATMLPGLMAWVLLRVKGGWVVKLAILLGAFMLTNFWFGVVVANRSQMSITRVLGSEEALEKGADAKHGGISMFSELGYMNYYFQIGALSPNWGQRYLAELANPIPRAIWKNKPTVGLDYAVVRGFASAKASEQSGGVVASIATGMIGQGVVNFGGVLGPVAAAFLISLWIAVLARQDLLGRDPSRLVLYACGLILTFNMGRDITLLVLYPYLFGWLLIMGRRWYLRFANREQQFA